MNLFRDFLLVTTVLAFRSLALPGNAMLSKLCLASHLKSRASTFRNGRPSLQFSGFHGRALKPVGGVRRGVSIFRQPFALGGALLLVFIGCDSKVATNTPKQKSAVNVAQPPQELLDQNDSSNKRAETPTETIPDPSAILALSIDVSGFKITRGDCLIAVYLGSKHFNDPEYAIAKEAVKITDLNANWATSITLPKRGPSDSGKMVWSFSVCAFHDENQNTKLDKNSLGIPTELYGFSRNPKRGFGPPRFSETALSFSLDDLAALSGKPIKIPVQIK